MHAELLYPSVRDPVHEQETQQNDEPSLFHAMLLTMLVRLIRHK